jgi:hypothetical protein
VGKTAKEVSSWRITYQVTCDQKGDPKTTDKTLLRQDMEKWKIAMKEEYKSFLENKVWQLADLPQGQKAVKNK